MCVPGISGNSQHPSRLHMHPSLGMHTSGPKLDKGSPGYRFDIGQRLAAAKAGGGTTGAGTNTGTTILTGTPKNTGVDALLKTTTLGV